MPYRRGYKKKSFRKKKRYSKRRSVVPRNKLSSQVYHFKRYATPTFLTTSGAVYEGYSFTFSLSKLPDYTEFVNMFDQYRINMVKLYFVPNGSVNQSDPVVSLQLSDYWNCIYSAIDTNDGTVPTNDNTLRQYPTFRFSPNTKVHKRVVYPKPLIEVYKTAVSTGYSNLPNSKKMWLATNDSSVPYYGLKVGVDNPTVSTSVNMYKVQVVYYLSFRNAR